MRNAVFIVLFAAVSFRSAAQQTLSESIEVRVASIDVVVTDKAGKAVAGLTKDDFVLLENGHEQPLTNFYEVRGEELTATATGPAPAEPQAEALPKETRNRRFVLFFDDYSMHAAKRKAILAALDRFVDAHVAPGDTMSIVQWFRGIHVIVPYTGDKHALHSAIEELRRRPTTATAENEEGRIKAFCQMQATNFSPRALPGYGQQLCKTSVDQYEMEATATLRQLLGDLQRTTSALAGVDGKKVLVLAGSQLPERPGLELRHFANVLFGGIGAAGQAVMQTHSERITIEKMARAANANGVTIYTLDTQEQHSVASAETSLEFDPMEDFTRFINSAASYEALARITGGVAVTQATSFDAAFETVAHDLTSYYSLGYRPRDTANTSDRSVVVRAKNGAYRVRSRKSFAVKTADEQVGDRVIANIFHDGVSGDWPLEVRFGRPAKNGRNFNVPIEVRFPARISLLPQDGALAGGFTVYIAVGDADGRMSDVAKRPQTIRIPPASETALRSKPFVFTATVMMRPGNNTLSVAVVDSISNETGFVRGTVVAK